ncbi:MAG: hypothetical protein RRY95_05160 [Oscillospiraceae bacterium]
MDETILRLTEERSRDNTRRIEKLEQGQEILHRLTTSVEVMVKEQQYIRETVDRLGEKLDSVEQRPLRRWEAVTEKILLVLVSACVTWVLTQLG